jgi:hypothetical protein
MVVSPSDVERIVREVLAEMLAARTGPMPEAAAAPSSVAPSSNGEARGDLVLRRRVVTLADLPERLDSVRRLVVPPKAVLTPSVQDLVRSRKLAVVQASAEAVEADGRVRAVVVGLGRSYAPSPVVKMLAEDGFPAEGKSMDCLIKTSDYLSAELRSGGTVGLVLTRHLAAATCLANRLAKVRMVRATTIEATAAEVDAVGANVLAIDARAYGPYPLRQILRQFVRGAPRACPEVFQDRLG